MCSYKHVFVTCKRDNYVVSVSELHDALLRRLNCCVKKYIVRIQLSKNNLRGYNFSRESCRLFLFSYSNVILIPLYRLQSAKDFKSLYFSWDQKYFTRSDLYIGKAVHCVALLVIVLTAAVTIAAAVRAMRKDFE